MKMMSSGSGVFFIQNDNGSSCGKRKSMPCDLGRSWRYINPKARFAGVSAISTDTRTGSPFCENRVTCGSDLEAQAKNSPKRLNTETSMKAPHRRVSLRVVVWFFCTRGFSETYTLIFLQPCKLALFLCQFHA